MRHIEESGIQNLIGSMKRRHGGLIMIEVKNLEKSFGEQKVLNDVSLVCPNGEITGIIGHNGSGKTVLFKCICGLLFEDSGEILIDGKRYKSGGELIKNAGIITENPAFLESESGINNLKYLFEKK